MVNIKYDLFTIVHYFTKRLLNKNRYDILSVCNWVSLFLILLILLWWISKIRDGSDLQLFLVFY